MVRILSILLVAATTPMIPVSATKLPPAPPVYRYADMADLATKAPMVVDATITDAAKIKPAEAAGIAPGHVRYYLTVTINALIRAPGALPPQIGYLYDAPLDPAGRTPKFKKMRVIIFARAVANTPDQLQLVTPGAQLEWSLQTDGTVRRLAADLVSPKAPPAIVEIANAFHAAGTLPGEGETQIFLKTTGHPISLGIQRKQNQAPVWTVSLSEVVEDALPPPQRDTFLWYRLACGLPVEIPADTLTGLDPADAAAVQQDYALVKSGLGPCRVTGGGGPG
jgi:hypothetical protein